MTSSTTGIDLRSSDSLALKLAVLLDDPNEIEDAAVTLFTTVLLASLWLHEQKLVQLGLAEIRDNLNFKRIVDLADPSKYPGMPHPIRRLVKAHLLSLSFFREDMGYNQVPATLNHHAEIEMFLTGMLGSVYDSYSYLLPRVGGKD